MCKRKRGDAVAKVTWSSEALIRWKIGVALSFLLALNLFVHIKIFDHHKIAIDWSPMMIDDAPQATHLPDRGERKSSTTYRHPSPDRVESSSLSFPTYTREMAIQAIRPAPWTCGDRQEVATDPLTNQKPIFAFVHVYKSAGSTMRFFFRKYADVCMKTYMTLISCTNVEPSSIQSTDNWKNCRVKEVFDRRLEIYDWQGMDKDDKRVYPTVNNTMLKENVDVFGGHFRIGTGDYIFSSSVRDQNSATTHPAVRYIVFLRDPKTRFVSGVLFKTNQGKYGKQSFEDIIKRIKNQIRGHVKHKEYFGTSLSYLLTPAQAKAFSNMNTTEQEIQTTELSPQEYLAEAKAHMAIQNLAHYNVIMGMTESMEQSMQILRHVLVSEFANMLARDVERLKKDVEELFDEHTPKDSNAENGERKPSKDGVMRNVSERDGGLSTASVLEELKKDTEFMPFFDEYVKYEQMITDFAWKMHSMQHEAIMQKAT